MNDKENILRLYTGIRVDVVETGQPPMELPEPDIVMDPAKRERFTAYHGAVLATVTAAPPRRDTTDLFKFDFSGLDAFQGLFDAVTSMTHTIEDVDGKFFGVTACQLKRPLEFMEQYALKMYCQGLYDEKMFDERFSCPASSTHGELSVHIWRDRSRFMLTEKEMEQAPWRKPKDHTKGDSAR